MKIALAFARAVDRFSERLGSALAWLTVAMVLVGAYNAVMRYLGRYVGWNLASNVYLELQWYLFSLVFLLGAAYALERDAHVRVDVFYGRLSVQARAWIDLAGTLLLLIPFSVFAAVVAWPSVASSWAVREASPDPGGLPRYPLKTAILVCFVLLILQGVSEAIKDVARIRGVALPPKGGGHGEGA
jgi:TRAP-type mannitol/chloroaromatic compound transport system permease small subunit